MYLTIVSWQSWHHQTYRFLTVAGAPCWLQEGESRAVLSEARVSPSLLQHGRVFDAALSGAGGTTERTGEPSSATA